MLNPALHHKARKSKIHEMKRMLHEMISGSDKAHQPPDAETQGFVADDPNDDPLEMHSEDKETDAEEQHESPELEASEVEPEDAFAKMKREYFKSKPKAGGRPGSAKIIAALSTGRKHGNGVAPRPFGKKA